jgi:hypothetical protein
MYMSRDIFNCKPGKAKDLVATFKRFSNILQSIGYEPARIFTDVCGENYWTVVIEQDIKTIDDLAEMSRKVMSDPRTAEVMKDYHDLIQGGRRELYRVE